MYAFSFTILLVWAIREEQFSERLNMRATFSNCTALHYAVLSGNSEIVAILLEHGMYEHFYVFKINFKQ